MNKLIIAPEKCVPQLFDNKNVPLYALYLYLELERRSERDEEESEDMESETKYDKCESLEN
jgi:hypothetical protein